MPAVGGPGDVRKVPSEKSNNIAGSMIIGPLAAWISRARQQQTYYIYGSMPRPRTVSLHMKYKTSAAVPHAGDYRRPSGIMLWASVRSNMPLIAVL